MAPRLRLTCHSHQSIPLSRLPFDEDLTSIHNFTLFQYVQYQHFNWLVSSKLLSIPLQDYSFSISVCVCVCACTHVRTHTSVCNKDWKSLYRSILTSKWPQSFMVSVYSVKQIRIQNGTGWNLYQLYQQTEGSNWYQFYPTPSTQVNQQEWIRCQRSYIENILAASHSYNWVRKILIAIHAILATSRTRDIYWCSFPTNPRHQTKTPVA